MEKFFTPVTQCYDEHCAEVPVPWVPEFEELWDKDQDIAILSQHSGEFKPGLYIRQDGMWWLAFNYKDLCFAISKKATIKVIRGLNQTTAVPAGTSVYRNGYAVDVTSLEPGILIVWCLTTISSGGGTGGSGTVPLTDMFGTSLGNFVIE